MDPLTALTIAEGLLALYQKLEPEIAKAFAAGTIPPDRQLALKMQIDAVRSGAFFNTPQWEITNPPIT